MQKEKNSELDRIRAAVRERMNIVTTIVRKDTRVAKVSVTGFIRPRTPQNVTYIFTQDDTKLLKQFLGSKLRESNKNIEIEASFGVMGPHGFKPGFKAFSAFQALKRSLDEMAEHPLFRKTVSSEKVEIMSGFHIRKITVGKTIIWQQKFRKRPSADSNVSFESSVWGIRVYKSSEIGLDEEDVQDKLKGKEFKPTLIRKKTRYSYEHSSDKSKFYGIRFDLTLVEESYTNSPKVYVHFEVEIERARQKVPAKVFINAIKHVLMWSQQTEDFSNVIALPERKFAIKLHNNLFLYTEPDPYRLYNNYWSKPENIKISNLLNPRENWEVTIKLDGVRRFLLFDSYATYMIGAPFNVIKVGPGNEILKGTLIDGEFMSDDMTFHCFDILFHRKRDLRQIDFVGKQPSGTDARFQKEFSGRKKILGSVFSLIDNKDGITIKLKKYYNEGPLYQRINDALDDALEIDDEDGLIFQPSGKYLNRQTLKWKPPHKLTIDFLVNEIDDEIQLWVGCRKTRRNIQFEGTNFHPVIVKVSKLQIGDESIIGKIVEFEWDSGSEEFVPIKIRDDRTRPNDKQTAGDVWNDIMDPITEETIRGDNIKVLRKYLNTIKFSILNTNFSRGDTIIDIGSGRGGDLSKWNKIGLEKVYIIEPNDENLKELIRRKKEMKMNTTIRIIKENKQLVGAENTKAIMKATKKTKLNGIVSFFSLTFFPKNEELYNGLIKTLDLLPIGGKFVGIVMDGARTISLLKDARKQEIKEIEAEGKIKRAKTKSKKGKEKVGKDVKEIIKEVNEEGIIFRNSAFEIEQQTEFTDGLENKIEIDIPEEGSMVQKQTEWLFYFQPFLDILETNGFIYQGNSFKVEGCVSDFVDCGDVYNILPPSSQTFSSLSRVFVFIKGKGYPDFSSERLDAGITKNLPNPYKIKLHITGMPPDPSNIVHAVFQAVSPSYRKSKDKVKFVNKWRVSCSKILTLTKFKNLEYASIMEENLTEKHGDSSLEEALVEYKKYLAKPEEWLGAERIIGLLSVCKKVNIYVLAGKIRGKQVVSVGASPLYCSTEYKDSVILYTTDNLFYSLVSSNTHIFNKKDPLIRKIFAKKQK